MRPHDHSLALALALGGVVVMALATLAYGADPSVVLGVPRPATAPPAASPGLHGRSTDHCLYVTSGDTRILAGSGCIQATASPSPTPTATKTATPTPTVTATPG